MDQTELLTRLSVSLAIGLLVGLERGWRTREEEDHQRAAGFRTFALSGLLGGISGAIALKTNASIIGFIFLGYTAAFGAFHWMEAKADRNLSVTSVIAGMLTFALGVLAIVGDLSVAIAGAVAMTVLLALREQLHRWLASLTWPEIRSTLVLLAMSFLLLPVLPNRTSDPWDSINPREIWLLAILIAGISFGGYIAVRALGDRLGVVMAAAAGGLASSTATTLTLARLGRGHPASAKLLSAGILIAGVVMVVRVGIVAIALNDNLFGVLALPLTAVALTLAIGAALLLLGNRQIEQPDLQIINPLELGTALKFAGLIAVIMFAAKLVLHLFGDLGVLIVAAISGLADVDAVTISMARMGGTSLDLGVATWAILIVVAVNTAMKAALCVWSGGRQIGLLVGAVSIAALGSGFLVSVWQVTRSLP